MIKDLRKIVNKLAEKVRPIDYRRIGRHLLLSDILYKELRKEGLDIKRDNVNLIVRLKNNAKVIIDCLEGTIYTNENVHIGKLRKFSVDHSGEIYNCAIKNVKRIVDKINSIESEIKEDNVTFKQTKIKDLRKSNKEASLKKVADLREFKNIIDLRSPVTVTDLRKFDNVMDLRSPAVVTDLRKFVSLVDFRK